MTDTQNTFVLDGLEVRLTGRRALKEKLRRGRGGNSTTEELLEVEPIDLNGPTWKRWVRKTELYQILE